MAAAPAFVLLTRGSHQSRLSTNGDNEMIPGAVHRSPDTGLLAFTLQLSCVLVIFILLMRGKIIFLWRRTKFLFLKVLVVIYLNGNSANKCIKFNTIYFKIENI